MNDNPRRGRPVTGVALTAAQKKSKEAERKALAGMARRSFWLDEESIKAIDKFKADGGFKTNDEAIAAIIKLATD